MLSMGMGISNHHGPLAFVLRYPATVAITVSEAAAPVPTSISNSPFVEVDTVITTPVRMMALAVAAVTWVHAELVHATPLSVTVTPEAPEGRVFCAEVV